MEQHSEQFSPDLCILPIWLGVIFYTSWHFCPFTDEDMTLAMDKMVKLNHIALVKCSNGNSETAEGLL